MSINAEKKFVIKHTFIDVKNMENGRRCYGKKKTYFNSPWRISFFPHSSCSKGHMHLHCLKSEENNEWAIDTTIETKFHTRNGEEQHEKRRVFSYGRLNSFLTFLKNLDDYLVNGNLTVECHVTIHQVFGIETPVVLRKFDDKSPKIVILKVKDRRFYVNKMHLAAQSTYFESLFNENSKRSKQSEVELKDIDPYDFQKFLEVLKGEPDFNDESVEGILKLADMYDAKFVIRQCEMFLIGNSKLDLKEKSHLSTQFKLEKLKETCTPEFQTSEDIAAIVPENSSQLDNDIWKDLLNLSLTFNK